MLTVTVVVLVLAGAAQAGPSPQELIEQYERMGLAGGIELGRQVAAVQDAALLRRLEQKLDHPNRRTRADAALVFALRGEERGFNVLAGILKDRSDRPKDHGVGARDQKR